MKDRHVRPAHSLVILVALTLTVGLCSCGSPADVPEAPVPEATVPEATESPADADAEAASERRGLRMNTAQTAAGYVFFNPLLSRTTYVVDVEGRVVHTWQSDLQSGGGAYLLDNGHLLRGGQEPGRACVHGGRPGWSNPRTHLGWRGGVGLRICQRRPPAASRYGTASQRERACHRMGGEDGARGRRGRSPARAGPQKRGCGRT